MEINDAELLLGWGLLAGVVILAIVILRLVIRFRSTHSVKRKTELKLSNRTKYPEVDTYRFSGPISLLSIAIALTFSLITISWTRYDKPVYFPYSASQSEEFLAIIPKTSFPQRLIPPIPLAKVQEIIEVKTDAPGPEILDLTRLMDSAAINSDPIESLATTVLPEPPPLVRKEDGDNEIFIRSEHMPRFPGCENLDVSNDEKLKCAELKLMEYIYDRIEYPAMARENRIEGKVVAQFVVEKDGSISGIKIVSDAGGGCGEEVFEAVASMNEMSESWIPGKQRGTPVRVRFTLPIAFKLN